MTTAIQTRCIESLDRMGLAPNETTRARIADFAQSLDRRSGHLDPLDQIELENAAIEYTTAWATAELLEGACGQSGIVTFDKGVCRTNPALAQAASARSRMRQTAKSIKALLKNAPDSEPEGVANDDDGSTLAEPRQATPAATREIEAAGEPVSPSAETSPAEPEQIAPPLNRAQRREQARIEARQTRKTEKRLRYEIHQHRTPDDATQR